jgi:toxin ParE1/3/4
MPRIIVHNRALDEIAQIFGEISQRDFAAALRVNDAIDEAIKLLAERPGCGALVEANHPNLKSFRFWPLRKYTNYLVIYIPIEDGIEVLRVIHGAEDIYRLRF